METTLANIEATGTVRTRQVEELQGTCKRLAAENARLADQMMDARLMTERYQRRAVSAEDEVAELRKRMAALEREYRSRPPAKPVDTAKLRRLERQRVKAELPYRLGRLVLQAYWHPLRKGLRLPAALLALRADNRRKRATAERPTTDPGKKKGRRKPPGTGTARP